MRPLAIDLFTGLHGWAEGLIAEGWRVKGYDIEDMSALVGEPKPDHFELVLQDVLTVHGSEFADADLIVGSSPCQEFSYRAMPWKRAKALGPPELGMALFWAQFRIQREASEAAGRYIPLVVENVKGAQPYVGRARWSYGSYFLWGDVPALMPSTKHFGPSDAVKRTGRTMCFPEGSANPEAVKGCTGKLHWQDDSVKNPGFRFDGRGKSFQTESVERHALEGRKNAGGSWFNIGSPGQTETNRNPVHGYVEEGRKAPTGTQWFNDGQRTPDSLASSGSGSAKRKIASAKIAKIPERLSRHIGRVYYPRKEAVA